MVSKSEENSITVGKYERREKEKAIKAKQRKIQKIVKYK
jgi:hypothetical protein